MLIPAEDSQFGATTGEYWQQKRRQRHCSSSSDCSSLSTINFESSEETDCPMSDKSATAPSQKLPLAAYDSDSEEEEVYIPPVKKNQPLTQPEQPPTDNLPPPKKSRKQLLTFHSDSEDEDYMPPEKKNGAPSRCIDEKLFPSVSTLLASVEDYCCRVTNITRDGIPMAAETFRKTRLHLLMFLSFLVRERSEEPTLEKLEQREFIEGFLEWVQNYRELQYSTLATYLHDLLTGLRFVCSTRGDRVEAHSMYVWLTRKRETFKKLGNRTTGNESWQALQSKNEWISW